MTWERDTDRQKTAVDGIAERAMMIRVLMREILAIAEGSGVPVDSMFADLSADELRRFGVREELTNRELYTLAHFWQSSTADCYENHGLMPPDPVDARDEDNNRLIDDTDYWDNKMREYAREIERRRKGR